MAVWVLEFKFHEWSEDESVWIVKQLTEYRFYANAELALKTAGEVAYTKDSYKAYGCPSDIYLYMIEDGDKVTNSDIRQYIASWKDLSHKRRYNC